MAMRFIVLLFLFPSFIIAQETQVNLGAGPESELYENDFLSSSFHKGRRRALRELMMDNSVAVFFSNPIRNRSNDVNFEYHQDPNFYYLTGLNEPNSILLVFDKPRNVNGIEVEELLFVQERDSAKEVWDGSRMGVQKAQESLGIQKVYPARLFREINLKLDDLDIITYSISHDGIKDVKFNKEDLFNLRRQWEAHLFNAEDEKIKEKQYKFWLDALREVKEQDEMRLLKKAIDITCLAQIELIKALKPGMTEYQSEGIIEYVFKVNGAEYPGFPSIQGSGQNSCVLHYQTNRKIMEGSNMLVSDVGAEYHGYTADITRTLPVNGKFSEAQKEIYEIVLEAQNKGIEAAVVGANFWDTNIAATTTVSQGLLKLGVINKPSEMRRYFMHGTSHYLGLDVHDAGTYGKLKANSVITVEPGIYIPEGSPCDSKYWGIGVRIEDDILITTDGPQILSASIPREIDELEKLMAQPSGFEGLFNINVD